MPSSPDRDAEPRLGPEGDLRGVQNDPDLGMWIGPFIMGSINTRAVRRSNALQDWAYGSRFRYREVMGFGSGSLAAVQAGAVAGGVGALVAGLALTPTRAVLDRVLPSPGEGPNEQQRDAGFFRIEIHARTSSGARYVCRVAAQGDPGYKATAVMFGESALSLALDGDRLPARAGVSTPATAWARRSSSGCEPPGRRSRCSGPLSGYEVVHRDHRRGLARSRLGGQSVFVGRVPQERLGRGRVERAGEEEALA